MSLLILRVPILPAKMIFDRVDANGSQVCSRDEIMAKLGKNVGQEFLDAFDGQSVFSANGNVTRIGFENRCRKLMEEDRKGFRAILKRCQDTMEVFGVAQSLFDKLDQDGSGTINSKEIVTQLGTHGEAFLKAFDGQNAFSANGNVTRREFSSRCRDLEGKGPTRVCRVAKRGAVLTGPRPQTRH